MMMSAWSGEVGMGVEDVVAQYARTGINYFGTWRSYKDVVADIHRNAARWPVRKHAALRFDVICNGPGIPSAFVQPPSNFEACLVTAPVEWHVGNYQGRRVGGVTKVAYGMVVKVFDRTHADSCRHEFQSRSHLLPGRKNRTKGSGVSF
jgi:hypothetical protein